MSLKLVRRHGSRAWYIRGTVGGINVDRSTRTDNEKAADAIRIKEEQRLLNRSIFGAKATVTFVEAAKSYLENGGEGRFMAPLLLHFAGRKLADIRQDAIDTAATVLYPSAGPATRNRHVYTPVSAVLAFAAGKEWADSRTITRPRQTKTAIRWLSVTEADRLVFHCSPHLKPLVTFLFGTGARLSEALYLQWTDVDLKRKQVTFNDTKNGETRSVPLSSRVAAALANLPNRVGPVFLTNKGKGYARVVDCGGQIKTGFRAACRRAGIKDFTPHGCRHTFATWHYAKHRDLGQLMELCGWKSPDMALRYAHVNVQHLAKSIQDLGW
jgi:integrase